MAIYDCFQYFNEDHMVDLRINILNKDVDYFVISESTKTHQGDDKKLNFKIENFKKYENKIIYKVADFKEEKKKINHKGGESHVEQHQRNNILSGLNKANDNDLIILSDSDEIPDLKKINQIKSKTKFTAFSQSMFMYKLNLKNINESGWIGSKVCLRKNLPQPQKLRDLKFKKYPFWGVQWHPEKVAYEHKDTHIEHSLEAIKFAGLWSEFFIRECMKNQNHFKNKELLINNYPLHYEKDIHNKKNNKELPKYNTIFMQNYFFV